MSGHIKDSTSVHWNTPEWLVEAVGKTFGEHGIDLDPCSNEHSVVGAKHSICLPGNGLEADWTLYPTVYVNPPYGRGIIEWIRKAAESSKKSAVIMVIPAAVDTKHWQDVVFPHYKRICFLRGRVKFGLDGATKMASTVPTAVVLFDDMEQVAGSFVRTFATLGKVF